MEVNATLSIWVILDDGTKWSISEGDIIYGLTYRISSVETAYLDAGRVRVIQANTQSNTSTENSCPPEPYVQNYIEITNLVIDTSAINYADLIKIPIKNMIAIEDVKSPDEVNTNEMFVNTIFNSIPGI